MLARGVGRTIGRTVQVPIRLRANQIRLASVNQPEKKSGRSPGLVGIAGAALLFAVCASTPYSFSLFAALFSDQNHFIQFTSS
jgi:hypothetical protein